ncbi:MAG: D-Ala-D-Ala carboxypeptidase family metallohydrolase [Spirochaetota bacterium]
MQFIKKYKIPLLAILVYIAFYSAVSYIKNRFGSHLKNTGPGTQKEFKSFLQKKKNKETYYKIKKFFRSKKVVRVVPMHQLFRQGTEWRERQMPAFALPPSKYWKNMVLTLKFLRKEVIPKFGQISIRSGFRSKEYNALAGGVRRSKHLKFCAVDILLVKKVSQRKLHKTLLQIWKKKGKKYNLGLGLYPGVRFHIDTCGYRRWKG